MLNIIEELDYFKNNLSYINKDENLNDFLENESKNYRVKFIKKVSMMEEELEVLKENLEQSKKENIKIVLSMLGLLENIEYMLEFYKEDLETKKKIIRLKEEFYKNFYQIGVKEINPEIGTLLNNNLHEPVEGIKKEGFNSYEIIEVLEVGYIYKEKVLKEAKVIVAK